MTNEQKLLVYLYGVDSIQHKQLAIALSDIPYQCVTKALRAAQKHGYVEVFMRDESRYVRISPDGLKYIRSTQKDALDVDKRAAMKGRGVHARSKPSGRYRNQPHRYFFSLLYAR